MIEPQRWEDAENAFLGTLQLEPGNQSARTLLEVARTMNVLAHG